MSEPAAEVKVEPKTTPLTEVERATLTGLIAARTAIGNEIEGYMANIVCPRLGLSRNRVSGADIQTGLITLASDAPA